MTINSELYALLRRRFGDHGVRIAREDVAMSAHYAVRQVLDYKTGRFKSVTKLHMHPQGQGEEYLVNCPFCGDTRQRLSINHRWGVLDERTGTRNLWLAQCYNEERCLSEFSAQRDLYDQVYSVATIRSDQLVSARRTAKTGAAPGSVRLPSGLWPLSDMVERRPDHPAIQYLLDRLIDPVYVGKHYAAAYCVDTPNERVRGRLVVPIMRNKKLVSWQARLLRQPINKQEVKWYTAPNTAVSSTLYNIDDAFKHQTVVVVEGIADVWGFGPQACAVFKKSLSAPQINLLVEGVRSDATIVVLFDPNQSQAEIDKGNPHHITVAARALEATSLRDRILPIYLPSGRDPGDTDRAFMRRLISAEAREARLPVSFGKGDERNE